MPFPYAQPLKGRWLEARLVGSTFNIKITPVAAAND